MRAFCLSPHGGNERSRPPALEVIPVPRGNTLAPVDLLQMLRED
jgi:hypothetical protein